ncbi:hypothetical protein RQP46_006011 [Phenoliferia psychrophenolica]
MQQPRPGATPSSSSPATVLARWPSANAQTAIALIVRRLGGSGSSGTTNGRRAVQIRPFRFPGKQGLGASASEKRKDTGRNLFVVRELSAAEHMTVFVEDPTAPLRSTVAAAAAAFTAAKGKAKLEDGAEGGGDEIQVEEVEPQKPPHMRWSCCTLGGFTQWSPLATPFDAFLQRVLLGGGPAANSSSVGSWIPRSTAISIEGWVITSGSQGGPISDWEVRVGQVNIKGGAAGGTTKGVLIEATYLPVPYLPPGSTFVKDYITSLIPPQAVAAGEIQWVSLDEESCFEAGLLPHPDPADPDQRTPEWEWTEKHSALAYVQMFQKEGLL